MKIKTLLQAPLILEKAKELNIDLSTLDPQTRVKIKDGCLVFESEKECFVSKPEATETPLEICKRLYFEGVQFEVCTTKRIQIIPSEFRIDYEYGDVKLYLPGAQKYTLYSKSFNSFAKIIEPIEQPEYYYLKQFDVVIKGDYFMNSKEEWIECIGLIGKIVTKSEEGIYRRKIQKNPTL